MKCFLTTLLILLLQLSVNAQTFVSGGIYVDETWALANSPYVATDNVVVFPGVTLTIEPGVEIKFYDGIQLEIREASLIAMGNVNDSITFTSNSLNPFPGIWNSVYVHGLNAELHSDFCNFRFAEIGLDVWVVSDSLFISNSIFSFNETGIYEDLGTFIVADSCSFMYNTTVGVMGGNSHYNHCLFSNNQVGIAVEVETVIENSRIEYSLGLGVSLYGGGGLHAINCEIVGNSDGIRSDYSSGGSIINCLIDSNTNVGVWISKYGGGGGPSSMTEISGCQITNNGIGILDTASVGAPATYSHLIKENFITDNNYGLRISSLDDSIVCNTICNNTVYNLCFFLSFSSNYDISNNYWCLTDSLSIKNTIYDGYTNVMYGLVDFTPFDTVACNGSLGIIEQSIDPTTFSMYPNPTTGWLNFNVKNGQTPSEIMIIDMQGREVHRMKYEQKIFLNLEQGAYFVYLKDGNEIVGREQLIVE